MIKFFDIDSSKPFLKFIENYKEAEQKNQKNIEAVCISSYNPTNNQVSSRFVNLKYIKKNKMYFFSNYESPKARDFFEHRQVAANFFWNSINVQIRIKGEIFIASNEESDAHFLQRSKEKNVLSICSNQSKVINSYEDVIEKYNSTFNQIIQNDINRPDHWGGFYIVPSDIEFWFGNDFRINKRTLYKLRNENWKKFILEP